MEQSAVKYPLYWDPTGPRGLNRVVKTVEHATGEFRAVGNS